MISYTYTYTFTYTHPTKYKKTTILLVQTGTPRLATYGGVLAASLEGGSESPEEAAEDHG